MINLKNKAIAFIAPKMYDYPQEIINTLEMYGAAVIHFNDRPGNLFARILRNSNRSLYNKIRDSFLNKIIKRLSSKHIDIVFIIKGTVLTNDFLKKLRMQHEGLRIIMYQWDINEKYPYLHLVDDVDECFVFDQADTILHPKLKYLPLFFRDSYKSLRDSNASKDIELLHIGSLHEGKSDQMKEIEKSIQSQGITVYWYLVVDFFNWFRRLFKGERYFKIKLLSLNNTQVLKLYERSKAILDLPQTRQKGLTMRTFEVLGGYKKLITTNSTILKEKIYIKELVYVLGSDDRNIKDFINDNVSLTIEIQDRIEEYSIHNWLKHILK